MATSVESERSLRCIICGYDTTGLGPAGVCPECGTPVGAKTLGPPLRLFGAESLRPIAQRLRLLQRSPVPVMAALIVSVAGALFDAWAPELGFSAWRGGSSARALTYTMAAILALGALATSTMIFAGLWGLTSHRAGAESPLGVERGFLRASAIAVPLCFASPFVAWGLRPVASNGALATGVGIVGAGAFLSAVLIARALWRLRSCAPPVTDADARRYARRARTPLVAAFFVFLITAGEPITNRQPPEPIRFAATIAVVLALTLLSVGALLGDTRAGVEGEIRHAEAKRAPSRRL